MDYNLDDPSGACHWRISLTSPWEFVVVGEPDNFRMHLTQGFPGVSRIGHPEAPYYIIHANSGRVLIRLPDLHRTLGRPNILENRGLSWIFASRIVPNTVAESNKRRWWPTPVAWIEGACSVEFHVRDLFTNLISWLNAWISNNLRKRAKPA